MTSEAERIADSPLDECECVDFRSDHEASGRCRFNGPGFDMCHGGQDCMEFRLAGRAILPAQGESK